MTTWVEESPPTAAFTEERDPASILFAEESLAAATWTEESGAVAGSGTAFIHVDVGEETTVGDYDIYVCENAINGVTMDANTPASSLKICYTIATEVPESVSTFWAGLKNAIAFSIGESAYFHTSLPYDITTRLPGDTDLWLIKPSAALGAVMGNYYAANVPAYFDGVYCDQSFGTLPDYYWAAYQTADDLVGTRPTWEANLDAHMAAFFLTLKGSFGTAKAVIGNTAGATFTGIDGITIEDTKIVALGEAATLAIYEAQRTLWAASANKYGSNVLNIAWDYHLNIANLVYEGTTEGALIAISAAPFAEDDDIISIIGNSMPGDWRPFSDASPWNTLLGASPPVHADSAAIMVTVQAEASNIRFGNSFQPPMWVLENENIAKYFISSSNIYDTWDADEDDISDISIPIRETMYQEPTSDGHIIIYSKQTDLLYEMSKYQWRDIPLLPACTTFNVWDASGVGYASLPDAATHWQTRGGRGSGVPIIGGLIRPEEIAAGEIRHALAFTFPKNRTDVTDVNMFQHPVACRSDAEPAGGFWAGASYPIEGMLFQLDPTVTDAEMTSWGLSAHGKVVAIALQQYGAYLVDVGGAMAFAVQLLGRTASEHRAAWDALFGSSFYTNVNNIPTSRLRVIDTGAATSFP